MKIPLIAALLLASFQVASVRAEDDITTVYYPNEKEVEFVVKIPSAWKMIPQGEKGAEDYFEVEGPNGLELSFRTIKGGDVEKAIKDHVAYLKENFKDVKAEDAKEVTINGMKAVLLPATATNEDGAKREIGAGWFEISDEVIGELWYNVLENDEVQTAAAIKVLNSLSKK